MKTSIATGNRRLLKLAKHLRSGKLGHKKFDFSILNASDENARVPYRCGTVGCALGECPIVFPHDWKFDKYSEPALKDGPSCFIGAEEYFAIDRAESWHLFSPYDQKPELYGGKELGNEATPAQVAANIEAFVARRTKE